MTQAPFFSKSDDPEIEHKLKEILNDLYRFYDQEIDLGLDRVARFLHQLGDPHLHLPPVIHVAGTNGKGSTLATLRSLLEASGKTVHTATSPHLVHPTERLTLSGRPITSEALVALLEECLAINRNGAITFFEMFICASFLAMSRTPADFVLLETGMGGRLDATNMVPRPACTIITTISKDHMEFLGETLTDIAFEKGGIIKAGVPCIIGKQTDAAIEAGVLKVFQDISQTLSPEAPLYHYGAEWNIAPETDGFTYSWQKESFALSHINLLGSHQIYNIGAAIGAHRIIMGRAFDAKILSTNSDKNPLWTIHWPGRLQTLKKDHPFYQRIPATNQNKWEIVIDGGHNDSAGDVLAAQASAWQNEDGKPLHVILAMVNRKDPVALIRPLLPHITSLTVTAIPQENMSYDIDSLDKKLEPLGFSPMIKSPSPEEAIQTLCKTYPEGGRLLITGSLYLMGYILSQE